MGIITRMRKQRCVYWAPGPPDDFGADTYLEPVEMSCRWEDVHEEYKDKDDKAQVSKSKVYVELDVIEGGVLWLGELDDVVDEDDPHANPGAYTIQKYEKLPNLRVTEFLRTAML